LFKITLIMATGDIYKLRLESIAPGGEAHAHIDGKSVFIEGGAPDETAVCRIVKEHKTWARAELLEITESSPARVKAACAFYGKCGGCNLQHIDYDAQLAAKTAILKDSFSRIGGFCPPEPEVFPCAPWEYRSRMQFHCFRQSARGENGIKFGQKGRQSGEIIAVSDCPVAEKGIRELLSRGGNGVPIPPEKDRFTVFSKEPVFLSEGGEQRGKINLLEREVLLDAEVFFQSNILMLEKLIPELRKAAEGADRNLPMADLYCGVGAFAVFLGEMFPKIVLAEENKTAVGVARENLRGKDTEFFAIRDTDWERTILHRKESFGFAVVDPPRAGLPFHLAHVLAREGPPVLAYVSCDVASLARDSAILTGGGYKLKELKLFDFYPQTAHIETLAVFTQ
jgi:23S rRNA (uracil1939-C5)-methyltransferase